MKKFIAIFAACLMFAASCSDKSEPVVPQLPVTFTNTSGDWTLSEWNGNPMPEGSVYIRLRNREFVLMQNVGSMYLTKYTGSYNLIEEEGVGTIIRGIYDYSYEYWSHNYIISSLTANEMVWTAQDKSEDTYKYIRTESFPEE